MRSLLLASLLLVLPYAALATQYTETPPLFEHNLDPRGMAEDDIKVTNIDSVPLRVYPTVNIVKVGVDGSIETFESPVMTDQTVNPTSWIAVSRAQIQLAPGESKKIPVTITVHPQAKPGDYYVFVGFPEGDNRDDAERKIFKGGVPGSMIRINVADKTTEYLRLRQFAVERYVTSAKSAAVTIQLENTGDVAVIPRGEVILYDMRGVEVGTVEVNHEGRTIMPKETAEFKVQAPATGSFGRHKAFLSLDYGTKQRANLYDTTFYTVIPLQLIIISFVVLMAAALASTFLYLRRHKNHSHHVVHDEHVPLYVRKGLSSDSKDHDVNLRHE
jgi:hypothetical protein